MIIGRPTCTLSSISSWSIRRIWQFRIRLRTGQKERLQTVSRPAYLYHPRPKHKLKVAWSQASAKITIELTLTTMDSRLVTHIRKWFCVRIFKLRKTRVWERPISQIQPVFKTCSRAPQLSNKNWRQTVCEGERVVKQPRQQDIYSKSIITTTTIAAATRSQVMATVTLEATLVRTKVSKMVLAGELQLKSSHRATWSKTITYFLSRMVDIKHLWIWLRLRRNRRQGWHHSLPSRLKRSLCSSTNKWDYQESLLVPQQSEIKLKWHSNSQRTWRTRAMLVNILVCSGKT